MTAPGRRGGWADLVARLDARARRTAPASTRVLLALPDAARRAHLAAALEARGYEVDAVADAASLLDGLGRAQAGRPDVVLLDAQLRRAADALHDVEAAPGGAPVRLLLVEPSTSVEDLLGLVLVASIRARRLVP